MQNAECSAIPQDAEFLILHSAFCILHSTGGSLMLLGRVIGQVVPCIVTPGLEGVPMLIVQPLDKKLNPKGKSIVAADATRMAGPGELVSYEGGRESAIALDPWVVPVDHAIIAIVDGVNVAP